MKNTTRVSPKTIRNPPRTDSNFRRNTLDKQFSSLAVLAIAPLGLDVSGTAATLPEVDVGAMPPIVAPRSVIAVDGMVAEPKDTDAQAAAS
jgi:hypothetical protein